MDYANGKIYKLVSNVVNDIYIGSTCTSLVKRICQHKCKYNEWKDGKYKFTTSFKLYQEGEVDIVLIENFPCKSKDELHARERYWIENLKCVNKFIPTRTQKEYQEDNKEVIKEWNKKYREEHKEDIKEKDKKYRENNREKLLQQKKEYYNDNKTKILEQMKKHREEHKEEINKKRKQKVTCDICNKEITKSHLPRHKKNIHK